MNTSIGDIDETRQPGVEAFGAEHPRASRSIDEQGVVTTSRPDGFEIGWPTPTWASGEQRKLEIWGNELHQTWTRPASVPVIDTDGDLLRVDLVQDLTVTEVAGRTVVTFVAPFIAVDATTFSLAQAADLRDALSELIEEASQR